MSTSPSIPPVAASQAEQAAAQMGVAEGISQALPVAAQTMSSLSSSAATLTTLATGASALIPVAGEVMIGSQLLATIVQAGEAIAAILNSPAMMKARENAEFQKAYDKLTADANVALQPGADLTQVEQDLS